MYSDSHCHFNGATEDSIKKARMAGVELAITAGIDMVSSKEAVKVAGKYDLIKACVGIHPWYADEYSDDNLEVLRGYALNEEVVAVSEIGLDYISRMTRQWERSNRIVDPEIQLAAFRKQIGLARDLKLPVLVHDRAKGEELLDILDDEGIVSVGVAIHGFSKGPDYARRAVKMGVYLTLGRGILSGENHELEEAVRQIPMNWLLTETDSGDPSNVILVAEKIAELKGVDREIVGNAATSNLKNLLGL
jgi:TatD DNase family protein